MVEIKENNFYLLSESNGSDVHTLFSVDNISEENNIVELVTSEDRYERKDKTYLEEKAIKINEKDRVDYFYSMNEASSKLPRLINLIRELNIDLNNLKEIENIGKGNELVTLQLNVSTLLNKLNEIYNLLEYTECEYEKIDRKKFNFIVDNEE